MSIYTITLSGCDDSTSFEMELTDAELQLAQRIAEKSKETSTYGCMPTMEVEKGAIQKEEWA